eukprot:Opistho-2@86444
MGFNALVEDPCPTRASTSSTNSVAAQAAANAVSQLSQQNSVDDNNYNSRNETPHTAGHRHLTAVNTTRALRCKECNACHCQCDQASLDSRLSASSADHLTPAVGSTSPRIIEGDELDRSQSSCAPCFNFLFGRLCRAALSPGVNKLRAGAKRIGGKATHVTFGMGSSNTVWLLGCRYELPEDEGSIAEDFRSHFWFTYRGNFRSIGASMYQTDAGWGCMLRCGQMILAQTLVMGTLSRAWRISERQPSPEYLRIASLFMDTPESAFSIHRVAEKGAKFDKSIGQWFGPTTMAQVIRALVTESGPGRPFSVHIAMDGVLCKDRAAVDQGNGPLLVLVPLRLGLDKINPVYANRLKSIFCLPQTVGMIGGKPNAAYYFVGAQGDHLLYYDPHQVSPAITPDNFKDNLESLHCDVINRMRVDDIDPSLCVGFYCKDRADFIDLCNAITDPAASTKEPLLFSVMDRAPKYDDSKGLNDFAASSDEELGGGPEEDDEYDFC